MDSDEPPLDQSDAPHATVRLRTLGNVDVLVDGDPAVRLLRMPRALTLLVYIALHSDWLSRDLLLPLFWPESTQRRGRQALRQTLYEIRSTWGQLSSATPLAAP